MSYECVSNIMSIIKAMKRAFGFPTDDQVDEDSAMESDTPELHYRASVTPLRELHPARPEECADAPQADDLRQAVQSPEPAEETTDPKLLEIFDGVLTIFNEAQPQFIRDCLDRDAQRRYLYAALHQSVESYICALAKDARDRALDMDRQERERLQADLQSLREREKQAEHVIAEQQTKQLSAQRQKRALTQRIEDNEKKIAELEAEKEQSDLQIRSLVNKLKVAEVKDGDMSAQRDEIEGLRNDVSARNAENTRLTLMLEQQKSEIADLQKSLDEANKRREEAESMQMTEDDRRMIRDVQNEMAQFEEIKKVKDARIASQKKQIAELTGQISTQTSQLEAAAGRISDLEAQLAALQGMLQDLQSSSALDMSLRDRRNMMQDDEQSQEPETVTEPQPAPSDDAQPAARKPRTKRKPKVSAIDENLDSVNWLLTTPSDDNPAPSVGMQSQDADFGYQPPVKKEVVSNDAQLTLF